MFFANTLRKIAQVVYQKATEELYDPAKIHQELLKLQLELDMGKISLEAYEQQEAWLLQRLEEASNL